MHLPVCRMIVLIAVVFLISWPAGVAADERLEPGMGLRFPERDFSPSRSLPDLLRDRFLVAYHAAGHGASAVEMQYLLITSFRMLEDRFDLRLASDELAAAFASQHPEARHAFSPGGSGLRSLGLLERDWSIEAKRREAAGKTQREIAGRFFGVEVISHAFSCNSAETAYNHRFAEHVATQPWTDFDEVRQLSLGLLILVERRCLREDRLDALLSPYYPVLREGVADANRSPASRVMGAFFLSRFGRFDTIPLDALKELAAYQEADGSWHGVSPAMAPGLAAMGAYVLGRLLEKLGEAVPGQEDLEGLEDNVPVLPNSTFDPRRLWR